ncbi:hypothetical protein KI387_018464, partial [Taxus chinensis]
MPFGTCGTKVRETRDSAGSGENVTTGPSELGTFGMCKHEVRGSADSAENGTTCQNGLGTFGTRNSDGPENGTTSGKPADRGIERPFELGTRGRK